MFLRKIRYFLLPIFVLLLSACGGGGESTPPGQTSTPPEATVTPLPTNAPVPTAFAPEGTYLVFGGTLELSEGGTGTFLTTGTSASAYSLTWNYNGGIVSVDFDGLGIPKPYDNWDSISLQPLPEEGELVYGFTARSVRYDENGEFLGESYLVEDVRTIYSPADVVDFDLLDLTEAFTNQELILPFNMRSPTLKASFSSDNSGTLERPAGLPSLENVTLDFSWQIVNDGMSRLELTFGPTEIYEDGLTISFMQVEPYSALETSDVIPRYSDWRWRNDSGVALRIDENNIPELTASDFVGVNPDIDSDQSKTWWEFNEDGSAYWFSTIFDDVEPDSGWSFRPQLGTWTFENNVLEVITSGVSAVRWREGDEDIMFSLCPNEALIVESGCQRFQRRLELVGHEFGEPIFYGEFIIWGSPEASVRNYYLAAPSFQSTRPVEVPQSLFDQME